MARAISSRRSLLRNLRRLSAYAVLMAMTLSMAIMSRVFCSCALHWQEDSASWQNALRSAPAFAAESARACASATLSMAGACAAESAVVACVESVFTCAESGFACTADAARTESARVICGSACAGLASAEQVLQRSVHSCVIGAMGSIVRRLVSESTVVFAARMAWGCIFRARSLASETPESS